MPRKRDDRCREDGGQGGSNSDVRRRIRRNTGSRQPVKDDGDDHNSTPDADQASKQPGASSGDGAQKQ